MDISDWRDRSTISTAGWWLCSTSARPLPWKLAAEARSVFCAIYEPGARGTGRRQHTACKQGPLAPPRFAQIYERIIV